LYGAEAEDVEDQYEADPAKLPGMALNAVSMAGETVP
jgi:hypothetical protein